MPLRQRVPRSVPIALCYAVLAAGCAPDEDARDDPAQVEPAVLFALDRAAFAEDLVPILVERQRAFFSAIRRESNRPLTQYIRPDFRWNPRDVRAPGGIPSGEATYLAMLGGYQPASLARMPTAYDVDVILDRLAWVYAQRADGAGGIVTSWELRAGSWRAVWASNVATDLETWQARRRTASARRPR